MTASHKRRKFSARSNAWYERRCGPGMFYAVSDTEVADCTLTGRPSSIWKCTKECSEHETHSGSGPKPRQK
eukprot:799841-Rhodomonas_salina.2